MNKPAIILLTLCVLPLAALAGDLLQEADSLYDLRGEIYNPETLLADPANIEAALDAYRSSLEELTGPEKEEAYWKLMRCYYFKGNHTTADKEARKAIYDEGKDIGYQALEEYPESAGINLWLAALWGVWAEEYGKMKAAKKAAYKNLNIDCIPVRRSTIQKDLKSYLLIQIKTIINSRIRHFENRDKNGNVE